jgi:hypothetical protein
MPVLSVEAVVEDEVRSFPGDDPFRLREERSEEPEESRKPPLLGLPSFEGRRGTPSDRVVSTELVLVRVPLGVVAALFSHEVGGSAGFDDRPVDVRRGRDAGGATTIVCLIHVFFKMLEF